MCRGMGEGGEGGCVCEGGGGDGITHMYSYGKTSSVHAHSHSLRSSQNCLIIWYYSRITFWHGEFRRTEYSTPVHPFSRRLYLKAYMAHETPIVNAIAFDWKGR